MLRIEWKSVLRSGMLFICEEKGFRGIYEKFCHTDLPCDQLDANHAMRFLAAGLIAMFSLYSCPKNCKCIPIFWIRTRQIGITFDSNSDALESDAVCGKWHFDSRILSKVFFFIKIKKIYLKEFNKLRINPKNELIRIFTKCII